MVHVNVELLFQSFTGHNFDLNSTYPIGRSYKKMKTHTTITKFSLVLHPKSLVTAIEKEEF